MATFKYGTNSLLALTSRVTTPSLHIQKNGNHWYVPLFSGNKGSAVQSGDYAYTLGGLKVGNYRAVIDREVAKIHIFTTSTTTWILTSKGELYGCGQNNYGQLGSSSSPYTFTKCAENVKEFRCTPFTFWYIDINNDLYGCGDGYDGQQGSGNSGNVSANVYTFTKRASNVKEVICTNRTTWYLDNNNNLYGCGDNTSGDQGSGDTTKVSTFTKRASNVKEVRCGLYGNVTWYLDNNNNLYGCGNNYYGQQGSGNSGNASANVLTFTKRASNVKKFRCTDETTWYIDNNNNLYGCGNNIQGQQGSGVYGPSTHVLTFTKRASNVKEVICTNRTTWYLDNNNNLYGCGWNDSGEQGSGDTAKVSTFTKRAENVKEVICTNDDISWRIWYLDNNNNLYGCGYNSYGSLGSSSPTRVYTFTKCVENVKEFSFSYQTFWYIDNNNNLYGCGNNYYGQQGSGDTTDVTTYTKRNL